MNMSDVIGKKWFEGELRELKIAVVKTMEERKMIKIFLMMTNQQGNTFVR